MTQTTSVVQGAVTSPLINLSSLITGLSTGLSVWSRAATDGSKGVPRPGATTRNNGTTTASEERVVVTPNGR